MLNQRTVKFTVDDNGWIMLSERLGKIKMRAHKLGKQKRVNDEVNQHTSFEMTCEGTVRVQSKLYDTSEFTD